jgi:hypothetical protein
VNERKRNRPCKRNAANDDCDANKFQPLGELINEGMGLLGQHAHLSNAWYDENYLRRLVCVRRIEHLLVQQPLSHPH